MNELKLEREQVAREIIDAIRAQIPEPDDHALRRAEDWIADALKDYERAILRAAGVLVKD